MTTKSWKVSMLHKKNLCKIRVFTPVGDGLGRWKWTLQTNQLFARSSWAYQRRGSAILAARRSAKIFQGAGFEVEEGFDYA